jgi:hypothetical protein
MREEPQLIRKLRLVAGTLFWGVAWLIHHRDKRTPASRYPDVPKVTVEGEGRVRNAPPDSWSSA